MPGFGDGAVHSLEVLDGVLTAGGLFIINDSVTGGTENVARWNGQRWTSLGADAALGDDSVKLADLDGETVAGGWFQRTNAAGELIRNIARWDGVQWRPLSENLLPNSIVFDVLNYRGELFAAGINLISSSSPGPPGPPGSSRVLARWRVRSGSARISTVTGPSR